MREESGASRTLIDSLVEDVECVAEFGWCLGLVLGVVAGGEVSLVCGRMIRRPGVAGRGW